MTPDETRFFLGEIQSVWRTVDLSDTAVRLWHRQLESVSLSMAEKSLDAYMRGITGEDFPPKPADILRLVVRYAVNIPTVDEAWRMVVSEVKRVGTSNYPHWIDGKSYLLRPGFPIVEVALAVESVGWTQIADSLGQTKEAGFAQKNFRDAYDRVITRVNEVALVLGVDQIDEWRKQQAASLNTVFVESPKGLFELGAPEHAAALIDGSGPRAQEIRAHALALAAPAELPALISEEQRAKNRERLYAGMRQIAGKTSEDAPAESRSIFDMADGR